MRSRTALVLTVVYTQYWLNDECYYGRSHVITIQLSQLAAPYCTAPARDATAAAAADADSVAIGDVQYSWLIIPLAVVASPLTPRDKLPTPITKHNIIPAPRAALRCVLHTTSCGRNFSVDCRKCIVCYRTAR